MRPDSPPRPRADAGLLLATFAAALLMQALLVANPGYFSHDELQWAVRADAGAAAGWGDIGALQYRPLTFWLWMSLSRLFFEAPRLFHLAVAVLGACNALLLCALLRRAGAGRRAALAGALGFVATPYAMYVHGWVGTLGDLLWVGAALGIGRVALRPSVAVAAGVAALLTAVALLAKESALSIPALAAVLALVDTSRRRTWLAVAGSSGAVALAYLAIRYPALAAPRPGDAYAWNPMNVPLRWLEYQLYAAHPRVFEVHNVLGGRGFAAFAGLAWLGATAALALRGPRWLAAWLLGGLAALGPVLVLGQSATQYGYAFAAWGAGLLALAWPGLPRGGRVLVAVFVLATAVHGMNAARTMHRVGTVQARFSADALRALAARPGVLRLSPAPEADVWIFQRITHEVPTLHGVAFSPRLRLVDSAAPADYRIRADGTLEPVR